jgi:hypothetical protein
MRATAASRRVISLAFYGASDGKRPGHAQRPRHRTPASYLSAQTATNRRRTAARRSLDVVLRRERFERASV